MAVNNSTKELQGSWLITLIAVILWLICLIFAFIYGPKLQVDFAMPEQQRLWLRTACYAVSIIAFPLINLIRHIQLRLNQTVPGTVSAERRYQTTILVSMGLVQGSGVLGLLMYILGDDVNTLSILMGMSALGIYLYRPKLPEFQSIVTALALKEECE